MTERNSPLFGAPGTIYIYRAYGLHLLLNLVAEAEGTPGAVLVRALEPLEGLESIRRRRQRVDEKDLCSGPGKVGQALAVDLSLNGQSLDLAGVQIRDADTPVDDSCILQGPRVGISQAIERPWRFHLADSEYVSRPRLDRRDSR